MQCILFADAVYFIIRSHYLIISHYFNQKLSVFHILCLSKPSLEHKSALGALSKKSEILSF